MKELNVYADEFQTTFANVGDMMCFLTERGKASKWIRKPTKSLRLLPLEKELDQMEDVPSEILKDTERNTQLVLKVKGELYPVRKCAIRTILSRAGVSGTALRKLEKPTYARVVNYCLQVASGDSLIKVSDGKISAVHGGDAHDYCILDMKTIFETTMKYLHKEFKGSTYLEGSGMYDHFIVFRYVIMILVLFISLYPIIWVLISSFKEKPGGLGLPEKWVFDGYITIFTELDIHIYFFNSIVITCISTLYAVPQDGKPTPHPRHWQLPRRNRKCRRRQSGFPHNHLPALSVYRSA